MRQAVDVSSLMQLRQLQQPGRPDAIARIVDRFLEETTQRLATLHRAVDTDDVLLLEQTAHALQGISGTVGANEMVDLAARLVGCGPDGRTDGPPEVVAELARATAPRRRVFGSLRG